MTPPRLDFVPQNVGLVATPPFEEALATPDSIDGVFVCLPKPLAGMGTKRQLQGIIAGLESLCRERALPLGYIGPAMEGFGPTLAAPYAEVAPADTVAASYKAVVFAFEAAFQRMADAGLKRIALLCMGYTAYGPESAKRALCAFEERTGRRAPERIVTCVVDSAYPDTDSEESDIDIDGWPTSRFYSPAFESTDRLRTLFLLTSAYDYTVSLLNARAPRGLAGASVVFPPYTDEYLGDLERWGREGKTRGLGPVADQLPGGSAMGPDDLLVPLVSSDIWGEEAVGVWMTREEHDSCIKGTQHIGTALVQVARRLNRRIWMPIDTAGARAMESMGIDGLRILGREGTTPPPGGVLVSPYRGLSQPDHTRLLGAADLAISRTGGQANATVVLTFAKTPNLIVDMPGVGYMQSELTSLFVTHDASVAPSGEVTCTEKARPLAWRGRWCDPPGDLAEAIIDALANAEERDRRTAAAKAAFEQLRTSTKGNVFHIIRKLIG